MNEIKSDCKFHFNLGERQKIISFFWSNQALDYFRNLSAGSNEEVGFLRKGATTLAGKNHFTIAVKYKRNNIRVFVPFPKEEDQNTIFLDLCAKAAKAELGEGVVRGMPTRNDFDPIIDIYPRLILLVDRGDGAAIPTYLNIDFLNFSGTNTSLDEAILSLDQTAFRIQWELNGDFISYNLGDSTKRPGKPMTLKRWVTENEIKPWTRVRLFVAIDLFKTLSDAKNRRQAEEAQGDEEEAESSAAIDEVVQDAFAGISSHALELIDLASKVTKCPEIVRTNIFVGLKQAQNITLAFNNYCAEVPRHSTKDIQSFRASVEDSLKVAKKRIGMLVNSCVDKNAQEGGLERIGADWIVNILDYLPNNAKRTRWREFLSSITQPHIILEIAREIGPSVIQIDVPKLYSVSKEKDKFTYVDHVIVGEGLTWVLWKVTPGIGFTVAFGERALTATLGFFKGALQFVKLMVVRNKYSAAVLTAVAIAFASGVGGAILGTISIGGIFLFGSKLLLFSLLTASMQNYIERRMKPSFLRSALYYGAPLVVGLTFFGISVAGGLLAGLPVAITGGGTWVLAFVTSVEGMQVFSSWATCLIGRYANASAWWLQPLSHILIGFLGYSYSPGNVFLSKPDTTSQTFSNNSTNGTNTTNYNTTNTTNPNTSNTTNPNTNTTIPNNEGYSGSNSTYNATNTNQTDYSSMYTSNDTFYDNFAFQNVTTGREEPKTNDGGYQGSGNNTRTDEGYQGGGNRTNEEGYQGGGNRTRDEGYQGGGNRTNDEGYQGGGNRTNDEGYQGGGNRTNEEGYQGEGNRTRDEGYQGGGNRTSEEEARDREEEARNREEEARNREEEVRSRTQREEADRNRARSEEDARNRARREEEARNRNQREESRRVTRSEEARRRAQREEEARNRPQSEEEEARNRTRNEEEARNRTRDEEKGRNRTEDENPRRENITRNENETLDNTTIVNEAVNRSGWSETFSEWADTIYYAGVATGTAVAGHLVLLGNKLLLERVRGAAIPAQQQGMNLPRWEPDDFQARSFGGNASRSSEATTNISVIESPPTSVHFPETEYFDAFLESMQSIISSEVTGERISMQQSTPFGVRSIFTEAPSLLFGGEKRGSEKGKKKAKRQRREQPESTKEIPVEMGDFPKDPKEIFNTVMQKSPRFSDTLKETVTDGKRTFLVWSPMFDSVWPYDTVPVLKEDVDTTGNIEKSDYEIFRLPLVKAIRNKNPRGKFLDLTGFRLIYSHYNNRVYAVELKNARSVPFGQASQEFVFLFTIGMPCFLTVPEDDVFLVDESKYDVEEVRQKYKWPSFYQNSDDNRRVGEIYNRQALSTAEIQQIMAESNYGRCVNTLAEMTVTAYALYLDALA
jgi:hypothetical protein